MARRVVVTGIGLVTPIAVGTEETWQGLLAGKSGIGPITHFDHTAFATHFAGEVKDFDPTRWMTAREAKTLDPFVRYAVAAGSLAVADSGPGDLGRVRRAGRLLRRRGPGRRDHHRGDLQDALGEGAAPRLLAVLRADDHREPGVREPLDQVRRQGAEPVAGLGLLDRDARHRRRLPRDRARRRRRHDLRRHRGDRHPARAWAASTRMRALSTRNEAPQAGLAPVRQGSRRVRDRRGGRHPGASRSWSTPRRAARRSTPRCSGYAANADAHHITSPAPGGRGRAALHAARAQGRQARAGGHRLHQRARDVDGDQRRHRDAGHQEGVRRPRAQADGQLDQVDDRPHAGRGRRRRERHLRAGARRAA